ncbi:hypothetical protein GCM10007972_10800 [Iodidimonas muriae]|uniref:DUF2177 family protein n=1 Tax=Iodidimonas muriae TaxID=261467 RepID=A0ABQ2LBC7_9PROT|nr:DUF2177 family protein [Iodidimonas muriae]GER06946.1 hypothetical protein JCM17843_12560 [Kordiimonadales bacterium JCM 17843]GGO09346.1 hypothetical protein GCM10007972_10800 [Iodidimonas muriae]
MKIIILYAATTVIFFALDAIGLRLLIKPVFDQHIAHLYADPFRVIPAAVFYLGYVAGILWFVSVPALQKGDPMAALIGGVLLGLMAYGTYEFTNYATLRDWSINQVATDMLWGGVLTGFSAWAGVFIIRVLE